MLNSDNCPLLLRCITSVVDENWLKTLSCLDLYHHMGGEVVEVVMVENLGDSCCCAGASINGQ